MIFASLCIAMTMSLFPFKGEFGNLCDSIDIMLLNSGRIQYLDYKDDHGISYRTGAVLIDASPETVWGILEDIENLGSVLTHIEYYRIRHGSTDQEKGDILLEGRFVIPDFPAQFTLAMEFDRTGKWRKWHVMSAEETASFNKKGIGVLPSGGLIKDMAGFEYLEPFEDGKKTVYYYAMNITSTIPIPEFIKNNIHDAVYARHMGMIRDMAESFAENPEEKVIECSGDSDGT